MFGLFVSLLLLPSGAPELLIAEAGRTNAVVLVSPRAGTWEKRAASDLALYIERMTGAAPKVIDTDEGISRALKSSVPQLIVGQEALRLDPALDAALKRVAKPKPTLRADAIVLKRSGHKLLLAGTNDDAHYYAVIELLRRWGCRWYFPTDFGEAIPKLAKLEIGVLDHAHGSPFEVRRYFIAWNGSQDGRPEFMRRNFMNDLQVPVAHNLGEIVKELVPPGKTRFDVPLADAATADHVANKLEPKFAKGDSFPLGMDDGVYHPNSDLDRELEAGLFDKYFQSSMLTDAFLTLYNNVAERLVAKHPESKSKIGFLAYSNITIPPQRKWKAAAPLVAYLAPIDIDPNHAMDDVRSPARGEYKEMLFRWSEVMQGRVIIYDYDQSMLVWRDVPNPSLAAIRKDYKVYRDAKILGFSTESRNAIATTFLNLHLRGQLAWDPDLDVDTTLADFYDRFFGPAKEPMAAYWGEIFAAWSQTEVTEHEHFVIPAIYTRELIERLRVHLKAAETRVAGADPKLVERVQFCRAGFEVLDAYVEMVIQGAREGDYKKAVAAGEHGLKMRLALAEKNPSFTTRVIGKVVETAKGGPSTWPGEIEQYRELLALTNGTRGHLLAKLPLEWQFRSDPYDTGMPSGWAYREWTDKVRSVRTDVYLQAQEGTAREDHHPLTGYAWYRVNFKLDAATANKKVRLRFPGLFNSAWLYSNGGLVAHRAQKPLWWYNDYKFEWDVDLTGQLKAGDNQLTLRVWIPSHFGGMFRRPFLYRPPEL